MNSSRIAFKIRKRIARFSGNVSSGLCLRAQHFVGDMIYGIGASQSVLLSKIGHSLEEDIALIKTEERLSRNLQRPELEAVVQENVLKMATGHIGQDSLLILDLSDITKKLHILQTLLREKDFSHTLEKTGLSKNADTSNIHQLSKAA